MPKKNTSGAAILIYVTGGFVIFNLFIGVLTGRGEGVNFFAKDGKFPQ